MFVCLYQIPYGLNFVKLYAVSALTEYVPIIIFPRAVIGSYHLHDCKAEKMIPIYLIVLGVVGLLKNLINLAKKLKAHLANDDDGSAIQSSTRESFLDNLITLFIVVWFIVGNVWIYR